MIAIMSRAAMCIAALAACLDVAAAETPAADHTDLTWFRDDSGQVQVVRTLEDWRKRRAQILLGVQEVMGPLPDDSRRVPLDLAIQETTDTPRYVRKKITYAAEPGDRAPAYLLLPRGESARRPAMLCLHQTTTIGKGEPAGLGGLESLHYAHELAERGFVCLAPDYPSFGDYEYDFGTAGEPYESGSMKAVWNNIRGVDLLVSLPEVDAERIGVIGHSLGGHNAIFTAVFDERLKAVVTSCGFTGFRHYYGGDLRGWTSDRYMPRIRDVYGSDPLRVPFDFHELIAAIAPRAVFISAPTRDDNFDVTGVREVFGAAGGVFQLHAVPDRLHAAYPDAPHEFPDAVRTQAYRWLEGRLSKP